jgi:hypothetical protein
MKVPCNECAYVIGGSSLCELLTWTVDQGEFLSSCSGLCYPSERGYMNSTDSLNHMSIKSQFCCIWNRTPIFQSVGSLFTDISRSHSFLIPNITSFVAASVPAGKVQGSILDRCHSRWPHGLRRRSAAAWLLGLRVRIPIGACLSRVYMSCCPV